MKLDLPVGYVEIEEDLGFDQSSWQLGLSHRRRKAPVSRVWHVRWDAVGPGAQRYLETLFAAAGGGAAAIEWVPPGAVDPVHVRMITFDSQAKTATDRAITATLEEVLEPCSSV